MTMEQLFKSKGLKEALSVGDKVVYRGYECKVVDVYPSGHTYDLENNMMPFMSIRHMGVDISEITLTIEDK